MTSRLRFAPTPVPIPTDIAVHPGPALLDGIEDGPSLAAHRRQYGDLPQVTVPWLLEATERLRMRGRGGAAFPFAIKLRAASQGKRPVVVVNLSEGEPASAKDTALALTRPHLVLDGAVATARALGASEVHLVLPGDRPAVVTAMESALAERADRLRVRTHRAEPRFVAGQARAVLELMAGRPNLPVTAWAPEAVSGHQGRPTLLSNAETWAQIGRLVLAGEHAYAAQGTAREPGTTLLTVSSGGPEPAVIEVPFGTRLREVLPAYFTGRPALVGGFHGAWAPWADPGERPGLGRRDALVGHPAGRRRGRGGTRVPGDLHRRGSSTTWPARARAAAARASTGCPRWPRPCRRSPAGAAAPSGSSSWPGSSYAAAPARTPTAPSAWSAPCSPCSPARWPSTPPAPAAPCWPRRARDPS